MTKIYKFLSTLLVFHSNKLSPGTPIDESSLYKSTIKVIKEGNNYLNNYFTSLKDTIINNLQSQINQIKSAYDESYKTNSNLLSLLKILIDNFDGNLVMETNIINNSNLNISECNNSTDTNQVISYFNNYSIIKTKNKKINFDAFKNTKIIKGHTKSVNSLLLLKDNRIESCSSDKTLRIFNPSKNYICDELLERHRDNVTSPCQLDDGTIVSTSKDRSIKIGNYSIMSAH